MENTPKTYLDKRLLPNAEFVLISYAHSSKREVYADLNDLYARGLNYWYDKELLSGDIWCETVSKQLNNECCCGIVFFFDINCLINGQNSTGNNEITGRSAVEKEIKIFEEVKRIKPNIRAFCVLNEADQSVYSIIRNAFIKCSNLSDAQLKQVLPEERVVTVLNAFNKDKIYILRTGDYIEQIIQTISKTNPLAVTDDKSSIKIFEDKFQKAIHRIDDNVEVAFGNYHQSKAINITGSLEDAIQIHNGIKYKTKNKQQFTFEPIKWILLETDGSSATLISKKVLDFKIGTEQSINEWIRYFTENAFNEEEKEAIEFIGLPTMRVIEQFGGKLNKIIVTDFAENCFDGGQCYVWLEDCKDNCRNMLCSITNSIPDVDYDYIDADNGIMPIIKIKLEKIRSL